MSDIKLTPNINKYLDSNLWPYTEGWLKKMGYTLYPTGMNDSMRKGGCGKINN